MKVSELLNKATLTKDEILYLLKINDGERLNLIESASKNIKRKLPKDFHQFEGTIEISNYCEANCVFCHSRNKNKGLLRFRLNREEIISEALQLYKLGKQSIILHSGYDEFYNTDRIAYIIYSIKKRADIKLTLSFGLREFNEYKAWKIAGADSYFLNFVTSNKTLYNRTNSWGNFEDRLAHISELKRLGYNIGSGGVIGLTNQTTEDIIDDILLCKDLNINYVNFCNYTLSKNKDSVKRAFNREIEVAQIVLPTINVRLNNLTN